MRRLVYSEAAKRDLRGIQVYISRQSGSSDIGSRFVRQLQAKCEKFAKLPMKLGRSRPDLRPDLRSFPVKEYVIYFRYLADMVEIVKVVERHRDIGPASFDDA